MGFRLTHAWTGVIAAACVLAAPAAHAFTIENKDAAGAYAVPKFDIEEQARNFRKDGSGAPAPGKSSFDTPVGKLEFGVGQRSISGFGFGPGFGPDASARASRQHMDRMLAPPSSLEFNGR